MELSPCQGRTRREYDEGMAEVKSPAQGSPGLAQEIGADRVVLIFLGALALVLMMAGQALGQNRGIGRQGLLVGFFSSLAISAWVLAYPSLRLARLFRARTIEGRDPWGAGAQVEALARRIGCPTPQVLAFSSPSPVAYAHGTGRWDSAIYLSDKLLDELKPRELEALIAALMLRIERRDCARVALGSSLASALGFVGRILDSPFVLLTQRRRAPLRPGTAAIAPLIFLVLAPFQSRRRVLEIDREAAALTGDPEGLASLIWRLDNYAATRPVRTEPNNGDLFFVNPLTRSSWYRYFVHQPSAERRIRNLIGHFPI